VKNFLLRCVLCGIAFPALAAAYDEFPEAVNTQVAGEYPPSPREMLRLLELPEGFNVTLFAGEPDVQQPIADEPSSAGLRYAVSGKNDPPTLLRFAACRIAQLPNLREIVLGQLLTKFGPAKDTPGQIAVLQGLTEGFCGQLRPTPPNAWSVHKARLINSKAETVLRLTQEPSALFGDGTTLHELRTLAADRNGDHAVRPQAISALAQQSDVESLGLPKPS